MAGTLLAYDDAFPRASVAAGPVRNTPSAGELRADSYPAPYRLLPIWEASSPETLVDAMDGAAEAMGQPIPDGGWQSTAAFLPLEGSTARVTPGPARRRRLVQ